ncbi:MAG: hypothetical protein ANABAC_0600 [Anaerolineae bacterium]|nr:MAG: hypothetical protein ANABAC_0600 [Anaerolineae bacterium]
MNEQEQKEYHAPAIVLEMELEARAGSSLTEGLDELFDDE